MAKPGRADTQSEQPREDALTEEAEAVEEQVDAAQSAEAKRAKDQERVLARKSTPRDATAAPSQITRSGNTAYSVERLTTEAVAFLGYEPHVVAGALHDSEKEYLTIDEAKKAVSAWLDREVVSSIQGD